MFVKYSPRHLENMQFVDFNITTN